MKTATVKCVSALSTSPDPDGAASEVVGRLAEGLAGETADLALVFASTHHAGTLERVAREARSRGVARRLIGCTGESIVGDDREVEEGPALSAWAASLPGVDLAFHRLSFEGGELRGWGADPADGRPTPSTLLLLGDPFSFPPDQALGRLGELSPGVRVVGGMASAGQIPRGNRLLLDGETYRDGAVAVEIRGPVGLRTVVSQGCRPIGRTFVVTRAERNVIRELGRRPALEVLREVFEGLDDGDRERVKQGLHIGRVISEYQESFRRGDFLVRNVLGADESGGVAVTDVIRVGQTVQFHVRDAASADDDLRSLLESARSERPGAPVRGALLFTCNGRGTRLFDAPNHDAGVVREVVGPVPVAGFFAMGELGPVGGQNFVHGFTASVVLFGDAADAAG